VIHPAITVSKNRSTA